MRRPGTEPGLVADGIVAGRGARQVHRGSRAGSLRFAELLDGRADDVVEAVDDDGYRAGNGRGYAMYARDGGKANQGADERVFDEVLS